MCRGPVPPPNSVSIARLLAVGTRRVLGGALALLLGCIPSAAAELDRAGEYQLKAAYLFNFSQFIEWPDASFADPAQPFRICVLGRDPFGDSLRVLESRRYKQRPIATAHLKDPGEARQCQILYLDDDSAARGEAVIRELADQAILTVSSRDGFAALGGAIQFSQQGPRVRMTINLDAARRAQLRVSAKLLEVALQVIGKPSAGEHG